MTSESLSGSIDGMSDKPTLKEQIQKMTEERDLEIIKLYATGKFTYQQLAEKFGITRQRVEQIINGKK